MNRHEEFIIKSSIESLRNYIKLVELKLDMLNDKLDSELDSKVDKTELIEMLNYIMMK